MSNENDNMHQLETESNFHFSGVGFDDLGSSEYTLATIVVDTSSSVHPYKSELESCLKSILSSCQKSPRAENLMLRLVSFNNDIEEIHGFRLLSEIDPSEYDNVLNIGGSTSLYDSALSAIEATEEYAKLLREQYYSVNGVVYILTDGADNVSKYGKDSIKDSIDTSHKNENLESLSTILIGFGASSYYGNYLDDLKNEADLGQYIDVTELFNKTSPESALAKLAGYISQSISATSQSLSDGSASDSDASVDTSDLLTF
jgi:uncharacterized protein YegL